MAGEPDKSHWMKAMTLTVTGAALFIIALATLRQLAPSLLFVLFVTGAGFGGMGLKLLLIKFIKNYGDKYVSTSLGVFILAGIVIAFLVYALFNAE